MPYTQTKLSDFVTRISLLMDDPGQVYWSAQEIIYTIYETLRMWGAYTSYWRTRGIIPVLPSNPTPYYDLSLVLPILRPRVYTLNQMVQEMQYMLMEPAGGLTETHMSGQVGVQDITDAIVASRNRFVRDTYLPLTVHPIPGSPPPTQGLMEFQQSSVFVHRVSWRDVPSGVWSNLWRQDAWAADKGNTQWPLEPGIPQQYSEAEVSPLKLQLVPPPQNDGVLEVLSVDSIQMDQTDPNALFGIPDEWVHGVKYAALSYLMFGEGQIKDSTRAGYAEQRYQQAVRLARDARSIIRLTLGGVPLPIDSMYNLDAGSHTWRNQVGAPEVAGTLYDMLVVSPGVPDQVYSLSADVVQSAPIPASNDYIQLGLEDLDPLVDYVSHILTFKCGGQDFKSTLPSYDSFMGAVAGRKGVNAAKIQYLTQLLGQPQMEEAQRPDRMEVKSNA